MLTTYMQTCNKESAIRHIDALFFISFSNYQQECAKEYATHHISHAYMQEAIAQAKAWNDANPAEFINYWKVFYDVQKRFENIDPVAFRSHQKEMQRQLLENVE